MALAAALMMTTAVQAQNTDSEQAKQPKKFNKTEMAQKRAERMAQELNLSDDQKAKLVELNTKYADMMGPGMGGPRGGRGPRGGQKAAQGNNSEKKVDGTTGATAQNRPQLTEEQKAEMKTKMAEMKKQRKAYETELKGILTTAQYQQYQESHAKMMKGGPRGPRNGNTNEQ